MLFAGLLLHRLKLEPVIGVVPTNVIIVISAILILTTIAILAIQQRPILNRLGRLIQSHRFSSTLLTLILFFGLMFLLSLLFFNTLFSVFITLPIFFFGLLTLFTGFNLFLYVKLPLSNLRQFWTQSLLIVAGTCIGLLIIEGGLRLINPNLTYKVLKPNGRWEFILDQNALPGLEAHSLFTTNSDGIRGDEYQENGRYNILAIGGSTTETALLDDTKAWTYLLQTTLNQEDFQLGKEAWVGNIGRSGHGLVEHIHALQLFVPQYRIDAVILLVGANDFHPIIQQPALYDSQYEDPTNYPFYLHRSFFSRPLTDPKLERPFPENTAVWNLVDISLWNYLIPNQNERSVTVIDLNTHQIRQEKYQSAPVISNLPDLTPALTQYRANLLQFVAEAKAQNSRLVLATQPAVWHPNISPNMERTFWFGIRGNLLSPTGRYDPIDLLNGLEQFNQVLLEICAQESVECVDLAAEMNGQEQYFYDDIHFNVAGSAKVAEIFTAYFRQANFHEN